MARDIIAYRSEFVRATETLRDEAAAGGVRLRNRLARLAHITTRHRR